MQLTLLLLTAIGYLHKIKMPINVAAIASSEFIFVVNIQVLINKYNTVERFWLKL